MTLARRCGIVAAVVALLFVAAFMVRACWDSRLPGTYSVMQYASPDDGGGPPPRAAGIVSVSSLTGSTTGVPDDRFTLTAEHARVRLASGKTVDALTFNGQVPGPELRVHTGDLVEVDLRNKDVDEGVTIHWHGIDVPDAEDGVAGVTQNAVPVGGHYVYRFRVRQTGTFWYHTHQDSDDGVRRGLYGAFVSVPREPAPTSSLDVDVDRAHARRGPRAERRRPDASAPRGAGDTRAAPPRQLERHERELRARRHAVRGAGDRRDRPAPDRRRSSDG